MAKAGIFTGLNNLDVFNITSPKLADKFGFTAAEAAELIQYYDLKQPDVIKQWYNGYIFGETEGIFNPWSMLKCVQNDGALQIYWANTSDNALVKRLIARASISTKMELESLLNGIAIDKVIEESIIFPDLDRQSELIWSLLLFTGYVTSTKCEMVKGKKQCSLIIPNQEIKYLYEDLIRKLFTESLQGGRVQDLLYALMHNDAPAFAELLQGFLLTSMSAFDLPDKEPEKSYHLFVLGLLVMLSDTHEVKSNRESGIGRYDILITPHDTSKQALILEFKKTARGETVEQAAQKALEQIIEKKYAQELYGRNMHTIIAYGIAFEGKTVEVVSTVLGDKKSLIS